MNDFERRIDELLLMPPYSMPPKERLPIFLDLLKAELDYACAKNLAFRNYVQHWPVGLHSAASIADLPFLPVTLLKAQPPLCLVEEPEIKKILTSSSTTGQLPSRVALDSTTARRMTKGVVVITQDF